MAAGDKLWLELGVRDEISKVLETLMRNAQKVGEMLTDDAKELKNYYRNINDIAGVYDKIYVAQKRISELNGSSLSAGEKKGLKDMSKSLEDVRKEFESMLKDPDRILGKGEASFEKLRTSIELMVKDTLRYVDGIEAKEKAEAINAANEERRIDSLKAKYYELQRQRKDLSDAIANAAPGSNTSNAVSLLNSITGKMGAVSSAQRRGTGMPASLVGADADEFNRKVRAEIAGLTSATNDYNKSLDVNYRLQKQLERAYLDAQSQQKIADIKNQRAEYTALGQKMNEIGRLMGELSRDRANVLGGGQAVLTQEKVMERLDAINRSYNETLAQGREQEKQSARSKQQLAEAEKKAEEAARNHANANRSLLDSYNKVSEGGRNTNRIFDQFQNQFAGYVSLYGIERLLKNIIQIGGEFEVQHIALQSILGDVQQANSMFEQMKELAVVSPFNFRQLATYSKQVAAFGIPYEEMYDTTKRLADMAAGLGVDMGRLILAYGQVRSAAVLRGQELRQFTEAGIPMVQALAQEFTKLNGRAVSTAEVFELISKRAVPFEMVKKVMWDMTNEGGRFFDMQFTLSDTLAGKWSNLQDAWEIMLSEFAKGESLSGQFLKSTVTLLTKLTETANTLMPILAGGGLFYMTKKIEGSFAGMGLNGIDANIKKAQQLQAIELRRKLINQEISREQYNIGMAMNKSQARYYVMLANEGKLKNYQIQRLIVQNKINNARLQELVASKELTMREAAQIRLWRMKNGEISAFQMRMNNLWSGAKSFLKANAWMIAIDVAITALTTWYAKTEEAKAKNAELVNSFANSAKEIKESYDSLKDDRLNSDDDYKSGIAGLKEQVKQHSANYEAILREANSLESLQEQYKYLKNALYEESIITEKAEQKAEKFGETTRSAFEKANEAARYITTGRQSFWDVMFGADTDVQRGLDKSIKNLYEKILEVVPNVGKNESSNELYRKLRNSLEEQLGFGSKEKMLINIKLNELFHIDNIEDATTLVVDKFGDMLAKAEPQIANKIRYGQELNQAEKDKIQELVNEATEETKSRYPYYADTLQQLLNDSKFVANIQLRFSTTGKNANDFQKWIYGNMDPYLDENIKNMATSWGESGNSFDAQNAAKRDIDAAKNELKARERQTAISQKKLDEAKKQKKNQDEIDRLQKQRDDAGKRESEAKTLYENRKTAALQGLGYDYEGELKKSNREKNTPKGKDTELEAIKNRVDLYKKFYSELESYTDLHGKAGALNILRKDGEFGAVFGWDNVSDLTNYKKTIGELTSELNNNSEARDKFLNSSKAEIQAKARKEETEALKNYISELQRMMSVMSENYQTYKKWLDLSGDAELAARVAGVTQNTSYSDWLSGQMNKALKKTNFALSAEDVFGLSETDVKKLGKDSEIFKIWDEWQKNQQKVRKEQWDLYEEAYKGAKNYDDKIADINRDLKKHIDAVNTLAVSEEERQKLTNNLQKNAENKIGSIKWDKFKEENNWGQVFGNLDKMPLEILRKMITAMKEYGKTTKMSVEDTKAFYEALEKLTNREAVLDPIKSLKNALEDYQTAHNKRLIIDQQIQRTKNNPGLSEEQKNKIIAALEKERINLLGQEADALARVSAAIKSFSSHIKRLGSSLSQLGSKVGGKFGDIMNGISGMFDDLSSGMDSIGDLSVASSMTGIVGAISKVSSVLGIASATISFVQRLDSWLPSSESIYQKYADRQREINEARERLEDYQVANLKSEQKRQNWLYNTELAEIRQRGYLQENLLENYAKTVMAPQEIYQESRSGLSKWGGAIAGALVGAVITAITWGAGGPLGVTVGTALATALGGTAATAIAAAVAVGAGAAIGTAMRSVADSILYKEGQTSARANMRVQTQHASFWRGEKTQNLEEWVQENYGKKLFGRDFHGYDLIDVDLAKSILDSDVTLVGETRKTLERIIELTEQIEEIEDQAHEYVSQRFSPLVDNMTDSLWAWLTDGENMLDSFHDYASSTFADIAKDAIKSFLKINLMDQFTKPLNDLYEAFSFGLIDEEVLTYSVANIAGQISDKYESLIPVLENLGTAFVEAFDLQGYDITGSDKSSSSSKEIKSVTENTAGLIASYLNAVRADTSVNRMTLTQILVAVQTQVEMPVIARAQLQQLQVIAGNTGRNVEIVDSIYSLLHTLAPDGTAIRVK